jgi:hypothetical protein
MAGLLFQIVPIDSASDGIDVLDFLRPRPEGIGFQGGKVSSLDKIIDLLGLGLGKSLLQSLTVIFKLMLEDVVTEIGQVFTVLSMLCHCVLLFYPYYTNPDDFVSAILREP